MGVFWKKLTKKMRLQTIKNRYTKLREIEHYKKH
jgi:hypothetical protein